MAKLILSDILGQYASTTELNNNFALIETALENTVSRDGTSPNTMSADLDMNSNDINNAKTINADTVNVGGQALVPGSVVAIDTAASVPNVPAGNIAATDVQTALNELDTEKMKIIPTPVTGDLVLQASDGELSKAGYGLPNVNADITASDEELNFSVGVTSAVQTQLDSKAQAAFRGALVFDDAVQSIPNNTNTNVTYDQESYDTDNIHDNVTNNDRLTVPSGVTKVKLSCTVRFFNNSTGVRRLYILKNGTSNFTGQPWIQESSPDVTEDAYLTLNSSVINVVEGDYFVTRVLQNSGGALNIAGGDVGVGQNHWFAMEIIE